SEPPPPPPPAGMENGGEGEGGGGDDYTKDGSVDLRGNPARRSKRGGWTACTFIVGTHCTLFAPASSGSASPGRLISGRPAGWPAAMFRGICLLALDRLPTDRIRCAQCTSCSSGWP